MPDHSKRDRDIRFLKLLVKSSSEVTEEEVAYFRDHPDLIDEVTAPVNIHKLFLWAGALAGVVMVALARVLDHSDVLARLPEGLREFVVVLVSEIGVALIGAAVTAYLLGVLLNKQQENAASWRAEIRQRIEEQESAD